MVSRELARVVRHLRRLARPAEEAGRTDAELVKGFAERGDENAFELLVARHGPMVLGLCQRLLRSSHDAEDAFQATFLVLVRKAGTLRERDLLGNWLYGVAYRIAVRLRTTNARRQTRERLDSDRAAAAPGREPRDPDLGWMLQEELCRLPDKYRRPVVLCYLEGQTNEEAARRLSWPLGTVKGRLTRARELLRRRLTRRGVPLSSAALAAALSSTPVQALPPPLLVSTVKAAQALVTGKAAALGGLSPAVLTLAQSSLRALRVAQLKFAAVLALTLAVLASSAGVLVSLPGGEPAASGVPQAQEAHLKGLSIPSGPAEAVDLTPRFTLGEVSYQEVKFHSKQIMKVMKEEVAVSASLAWCTSWKPLARIDGRLVVEQKFTAFKMDYASGHVLFAFDSTAKQQPTLAHALLARILGAADWNIHVNCDPQSEEYMNVVRIEGVGKTVQALRQLVLIDKSLEPYLDALIKEDVFKDHAPFPRALPGRTVHKGYTWTASDHREMGPVGKWHNQFQYTYRGPESGFDKIDMQVDYKYAPPALATPGLPFKIKKADLKTHECEGHLRFDRQRGRIVEGTLNAGIRGKLTLEIGGTETEVDVETMQRMSMRTTDTRPAP